MAAEAQVVRVPFHKGNKYKIFNASNPATPGRMVTYDPEPAGRNNFHIDNKYRFRKNDGTYIYIPHFDENPLYGKEDLFVAYTGNVGGRRKSRCSKRSKRSHRKTKRRHH